MSKRKFIKETAIKILPFIFAILLWSYVMKEQNPEVPKDINIPVKIVNLEALERHDLVMMENPNSFTINLKVKGKKETLDRLGRNSFNAFADINNYTNVGENIVPVVVSGIPEGVAVTSGSDNSIKVTLDKKLTVQKAVTANITGNPIGGKASLEAILTPSEVVMTGAKTIVDRVKTVRVDVDIAGVGSNVSRRLPVRLLDENGKDVTGVQLDTQWVNVIVPVANTKRVPIQLVVEGTAAEGYVIVNKAVQPKEILVTGDQQALDKLSAINTTLVKLDNPVEDVAISASLDLPEGIWLVNQNEVFSATIDVEKVVTKTFDINTVEFKNMPKGLAVDGTTDITVKVTLKGPEVLVNNIEQSVDLYIDLTNAKEGHGSYPIMWNKSPMIEVVTVEPGSLELDIKTGE